MPIRCGTSGFGHDEWVGWFYPEDLASNQRLGYYAKRLATVEINNTFYRMPRKPLLEKWASEVPESFVFSLKASQGITHMRRLANAQRPLADLLAASQALGARLGPLLFVMPPAGFAKDLPRLRAFLELIPAGTRVAFELRDPAWHGDDVYQALAARGAALCVTEGEPWAAPLQATASFGYLRLRHLDYDDAALDAWAERLRAQRWDDAFVYFRHGAEGRGAALAIALARRLA